MHQAVLEGFKSEGQVHKGGPGGIADVFAERTGDLDGTVGVGYVHVVGRDGSADGSNVHNNGQGASTANGSVIGHDAASRTQGPAVIRSPKPLLEGWQTHFDKRGKQWYLHERTGTYQSKPPSSKTKLMRVRYTTATAAA